MATEVIMPKLSQTMEEAVVLEWLKQEGDRVEEGKGIALVETDKAQVEIEAPASGILGRILIPAGATVAVGETIAYIVEPGEAIPGGGGARE